MKKLIQFGLIISIGGFFLYYVFKDIQWAELLEKMQKANYYWLSIGISISLLSHWIRAYRATLLYDAMQYKISTKNSFYAVLIGYMMNYIIPRAGEVSRCAALRKTNHMPVEKSLGSVVTERIVDMALLLLILGAIFLLKLDLLTAFINETLANNSKVVSNNSYHWKYLVLIGIGLTTIFLFVIRKRLFKSKIYIKIFELIQGFGDGLMSIKHVKKPFLFVILSVLIWAGYILMMYFCLFALESTSNLTFTDCLVVFAIGTIGVVLPAPGAGAGTYHFFVMQSLLLFGVPKEDGIAYATLVHGLQMIILLLIGSAASLLVMSKQKEISNEQA